MLTIKTKYGEYEFEDDSIKASEQDIADIAEIMFDIIEGETIREVFDKMWKGKTEDVDELS